MRSALIPEEEEEVMNDVYKTNIYGLHSSLWVKTNGPGDCAPQQNSTIAVTARPHSIVLTRAEPLMAVYIHCICIV